MGPAVAVMSFPPEAAARLGAVSRQRHVFGFNPDWRHLFSRWRLR